MDEVTDRNNGVNGQVHLADDPEARRKRRINQLTALGLIVGDQIAVAAAMALAYWVRFRAGIFTVSEFHGLSEYWAVFLAQAAVTPVVFYFMKLYRVRKGASKVDEGYRVISGVAIMAVLVTATTTFLTPDFSYSRGLIVLAWLLSVALVWLERQVVWWVYRRVVRRGLVEDRVLLVGTGELANQIVDRIVGFPDLGYRVVGAVSDQPCDAQDERLPLLGRVAALRRVVREHGINEVIVVIPGASHQQIMEIVTQCSLERVNLRVFPDLFQIVAGEVSIAELGGMPLLNVRDIALRGYNLVIKRIMDVAICSVFLIIASPIFILIAIAIKITSPGPAFYVQERVGLDGVSFPTLKFRSMRVDAETKTGPVWATGDDRRRTRLGTLMRRFSIDELPQLINVFFGQMSMVGPRPERPVFVEQFSRQIPRYMERHREKAGLTGWAQVNGLRGDTSITERTAYDLWYVENWSVLLDIKILLRTGIEVMRGRNAY